MALILAIEPDRQQAAQLASLIRTRVGADLVLTETTEQALAAIGDRVPDLVLVPALLAPQDDATLAAALRVIAVAAHVQMLTIPVLAAASHEKPRRGLLARWRRSSPKPPEPGGCDPATFGDQIAAYLLDAAADRVTREPKTAVSAAPVESAASVEAAAREAAALEAAVREAAVREAAALEAAALEAAALEAAAIRTAALEAAAREAAELEAAEIEAAAREEAAREAAALEAAALEAAALEAAALEAAALEAAALEAAADAPQSDDLWRDIPFDDALLETTPDDSAAFDLGPLERPAPGGPIEQGGQLDLIELPAPLSFGSRWAWIDLVDILDVTPREALSRARLSGRPQGGEEPLAIETFEHEERLELWMPLACRSQRVWPILEGVPGEAFEPMRAPAEFEAPFVMDPVVEPVVEAVIDVVVAAAIVPAAPVPNQAPPARPEWLELIESLRRDVERLRTERAEPPLAVVAPAVVAPAAVADVADVAPKTTKRAKPKKPLQDEWGFFDPEQCGFAALLAKLEEITQGPDESSARPN